uniref:acetylornithine transaminase n=1 Tax=Kwoniella pini CBS 10737 TaxID=1296096 RepID=A0A1B9HS53_9TREE|nr:acetylornithine aminotransferase [Kwoniella pini CBS 10737]OCF46115.1 acetylornithine aminotransferase [Kwoniella pini CBS 10737]
MSAQSVLRLAGSRASNSLRASLIRGYATEVKPNLQYLKVTHPDSAAPASTHALIKDHSEYLLNTYVRPPLLFTKGKGLILTDSSNREYLDFTAGIAVTALGHSDEGVNQIINEQTSKISHASNIYWNEHAGELAKSLVEKTRQHGGLGLNSIKNNEEEEEGQDKGGKVFFSNSGTEANEGALKFARAYGKLNGNQNKTEIVCFSNAFHGRSMGALSVTPNPKYQEPFQPLIPNIKVGKYNEESNELINDLINENTCGVIVEPIQGEGGVTQGKIEFLTKVAKRAREVGAVLIYDEIQCGLFRSGTMWAHSEFPIEAHPDIITMAKPLSNGFPIGAIMVRSKIAKEISPGMHGTTFGGQPLATSIGIHVLERLSNSKFLSNLKENSIYLNSKLENLPKIFPNILENELRGIGLIRGIVFKNLENPSKLVKLSRERGLLILNAGSDAIRLVPALTVSKDQIDHALGIIESCLSILDQGEQKA